MHNDLALLYHVNLHVVGTVYSYCHSEFVTQVSYIKFLLTLPNATTLLSQTQANVMLSLINI